MKVFLITLSFFLFLSGGQLQAQMMVEEAEPVPAAVVAEDRVELEGQKKDLDSEFQAITSGLQEYNALCSVVGAAGGCQGRYYALTGRMSTYQASLLRYRSAIREATKK